MAKVTKAEQKALDTLRRALAKPKTVKELELSSLTKFPIEVARLTSLESLDIHLSAFRAVPKEIAALPKLAKLELNWIQGFNELPDEVLAMPSLREVCFYESDLPKTYQQAQINALLKGFAKTNASPETRLLHVALLLGNEERASKLGTIASLANALDSNVAVVRAAALGLLAKKLGTPKPKIGKDSEIVVVGKLAMETDVLAERLEKLGAKLAKKIGPKTAAIVLGEQPKGKALPLLEEAKKRKDITVLVEEHLRMTLDAKDAPFLVAEAKKDGASVARIGELLASSDSGSRKLAVEMMKKGGVPNGVFEELLLLTMDTEEDKKLRDSAKKLLEQYAPHALKDGVKKVLARTSFYASGETKVCERIQALGTAAKGAIDPIKLAKLLLPARRGFSFLFAVGGEHARAALEALMKGDTLDLSGGELDELPAAIAELPGLRKLLLGFEGNSRNHLRTIPDVILGLDKLEELDISENRLSSIPDKIEKLSSLRARCVRQLHSQVPDGGVPSAEAREARSLHDPLWRGPRDLAEGAPGRDRRALRAP